jgi:hypothetical protein
MSFSFMIHLETCYFLLIFVDSLPQASHPTAFMFFFWVSGVIPSAGPIEFRWRATLQSQQQFLWCRATAGAIGVVCCWLERQLDDRCTKKWSKRILLNTLTRKIKISMNLVPQIPVFIQCSNIYPSYVPLITFMYPLFIYPMFLQAGCVTWTDTCRLQRPSKWRAVELSSIQAVGCHGNVKLCKKEASLGHISYRG